jgi:hypothetical protein
MALGRPGQRLLQGKLADLAEKLTNNFKDKGVTRGILQNHELFKHSQG